MSVKAKTGTYSISGKDGNALLDAMDRRGPKHGFLTRAIAQTSYTVSWDVDWKEKAGACRVANAAATLSITYTYPQVKGTMSPDLQRRWVRFIAGVRKHEETHGRLARQMVGAAEKSLSGISYDNDPRCRKTQAELKKRIALTYAKYEARQIEFDRVEHAEGGNVEAAGDACSARASELRMANGNSALGELRLTRSRASLLLTRYSLFHAVAVSAFSSGAAPPSSENSTSTGRWSEPTASSVFADRITMSPLAKTWSIGRPA